MRNHTRSVVCLVMGSIFGVVLARQGAAPAHAAPPAVQRWEYNCFNKFGRAPGGRKPSDAANELGAAGWEMVAAAGNGSGGDAEMVFCFKRPL